MKASLIRELIVAGVVLLFSLVVLFVVIPSQIEQAVAYDLASLSPAFFPKLAVFIIAGLSVLLILGHLRRYAAGRPAVENDAQFLSKEEELRVVAVIAVSIVYYLVLDYFGFFLTNTAGVAVLLWIQDRSRIWWQVFIGAATTGLIYLFFYFVMRVHFPIGKIFT
jgi:hypothetical protein